MKRACFIAGAAATAGWPRAGRAQEVDVHDLVARIPGVTGVYARTMANGPPAVAVRDGEPFASASVIKLAIMAAAYRAFDAGTAAPDDLVTLRAADLIGGSPVIAGARAGDRLSLRQLVLAMIRASDNSASNTLITQLSFATINGVMRDAGFGGTRLRRHFADTVPEWRVSENVTTPRDMALLLYGIERGAREGLDTVARSASCRAMIDVLLGQEDRSKIPRGLPAGTPCANKTGEITGVRNDAAIVDPYGDAPFVLVVLTRALRDTSAANSGIAAIARRLNAALRTAPSL
ncbi:MAG: serine hydrolase [Candidatus Velthaea sp.]